MMKRIFNNFSPHFQTHHAPKFQLRKSEAYFCVTTFSSLSKPVTEYLGPFHRQEEILTYHIVEIRYSMLQQLLSTVWVGALLLSSRGTLSFTAASRNHASTIVGGTALATKTAKREQVSAAVDKESNHIINAGEMIVDPAAERKPLKVLFLSADTGGGHRASAESLANQFMIHFPGSSYDLLDIWTEDGVWPYRTLVDSYKHLSANPQHWRILYHLSNTRPWEIVMDWHSGLMCEKKIRRRIESYDPDVIVSVHPAMQLVPIKSARRLSREKGKHIPFFTVVTDLGSGHATWFQKKTERMYLASDQLYKLARRRGGTPKENIVMSGLPIRHDFAVQSEKLGDRLSPEGKEYQKSIKQELGTDPDKPMVLLMGGGEGKLIKNCDDLVQDPMM